MRICETNTQILRAKPQLKTDAMFIEFQLASPSINGSPKPRRIELYAGRGRKENASVTQSGARFPNGSPGGKHVPEFTLRLGRSFRMTHQAEVASQNLRSEWDSFSGWWAKRKLRPGICFETGTRFPNGGPGGKFIPESALRTGHAFPTAVQAESSSRNPASNWDALSAPSPQLQNLCALHSKTG